MKNWITKPVHPVSVSLLAAFWAGLVYFNFYPDQEQKEERLIFVHQRVPDAISIRQLTAVSQPEVLQDILGIDRDIELEDATALYDELQDQPGIPIEAAPSWALLFHLLGEPQLATRSLNIDPGENETVRNQLATVKALIHETEAPPDIEQLLDQRHDENFWSVPEYFYLAKIKNDQEIANWLNRTSEKMIFRILGADLIFWAFAIISLLSLVRALRHRRTTNGITLCRIHQSWSTSRLFTEFLIAEILSHCVLLLLQPFYNYAYSGTLLLSSLASQVIPAAWLVLRLHIGPSMAMKAFRITGRRGAPTLSASIGLSGFALLMLGGILIAPLDTKNQFLTDSISPHFLDYLPSISTDMLLAVILAPIFEEIVFRGFLFGGLRYKMGDLSGAILSSLIFSAVHGYSPVGFVSIVISGLIFCGLYRWSGSLVPGMIAHAAFNLVLTTGTIAEYSIH